MQKNRGKKKERKTEGKRLEISSGKLKISEENFAKRWAQKRKKKKKGRYPGEVIKKKWKEYREELYKEDLNEPDYYDGMVSHPQPDILECEIKWPLESLVINKTSRCDGIIIELFKTLKDDAIKVLHSVC